MISSVINNAHTNLKSCVRYTKLANGKSAPKAITKSAVANASSAALEAARFNVPKLPS